MKEVRNATHVKRKGVIALLVVKTDDTIASFLLHERLERYKGDEKHMNVVLTAINAKYIHSNLAAYSLRAYAAPYKDEVQIAEYTINQQLDDILMDLYKKKPDILSNSPFSKSLFAWLSVCAWMVPAQISTKR